MDVFCEYLIKKKMEAKDFVLIVLLGILAIGITGFILLAFLMFGQTFMGLNLLMVVGVWWFYIKFAAGLSVEYEFTLTNHELDIDRIKAKSRRAHISTVNLKKIEYFGKRTNPKVAECMKHSGQISREYYYVSSKKAENIYVTDVISKKDGSKIRINLELSDNMVKNIRLANPAAVFLEEEF